MDKIKKTDILYYIVKNAFICFLVIFLGIYISTSNGTTNYKAYQKSELTKDAIKRFEQDVKEGKNINLENYIEINDNIPSNKVSRIGTYLSDKITILAKNSIKLIGKIFETIFGE